MFDPHSRVVVLRSSDAEWVERAQGIRTRYLVSPAHAETTFLTGITEFGAGASLPLHSHNCQESVVILEGDALFEAADDQFYLAGGDTTMIEAGVAHRFANEGTTPLKILWIYGSASATRTLAATGETVAVGSSDDRHW